MSDRDRILKTIRPEIPTIQSELAENSAEEFQNETLRPILKLQNDLILGVFQNSLQKRKVKTTQFSDKQFDEYIEKSLVKDHQLRNLLIGIAIAHFTLQELEVFQSEEKELKKRCLKMIIQRLQSQKDKLRLLN